MVSVGPPKPCMSGFDSYTPRLVSRIDTRYTPRSSSGIGHHPLTVTTRVRLPHEVLDLRGTFALVTDPALQIRETEHFPLSSNW